MVDGGAGSSDPSPTPSMISSCTLPASVLLAALVTAPTAGGQDLGTRVQETLVRSCFPCHGRNDKAPLDYFVLDQEALVDTLDLFDERIFLDGDMPPRSHRTSYERKFGVDAEDLAGLSLTEAELADLRAWIDAGAPAWPEVDAQRAFVSQSQIVDALNAHLATLPEGQRSDWRYLSLANLANAGDADADLALYRNAVRKTLASLTWRREPLTVAVVEDTQEAVLGFRLSQLGPTDAPWDAATWARIASHNPYGLPSPGGPARRLELVLGSDTPFLRADWFVYAVTRPPLYHDLLGLPGTVQELEVQLGVDVPANLADGVARRAGTTESGVSANHRIIERHPLPMGDGAYWLSYDFRRPQPGTPSSILDFPLGPGGDETFRHAGGEYIWNLPNGMQAYYLAEADGKRLNVAPTDIVQNVNRADAVVINGISCMECHAQGMRDVRAQVRPYVEATAEDVQLLAAVERLYPGGEAIGGLIDGDRARFQAALARAGLEDVVGEDGKPLATEPIARLVARFDQKVDLDSAAVELDLTPDQLLGQFESPLMRKITAMVRLRARLEHTRVSRDEFVGEFQRLKERLFLSEGGFVPLPDILGEDVDPGAFGPTLRIDFEDEPSIPFSGKWAISEDEAHGGARSLRSGVVGDAEASRTSITAPRGTGRFSLRALVSSEGSSDRLEVYVDGRRVLTQGDTAGEWLEHSFLIPPDEPEIELRYAKDGSVTKGADRAWVDDLVFLPSRRRPSDPVGFEHELPSGLSGTWIVDGSLPFRGARSAHSPSLSDNQSASLTLPVPEDARRVTFQCFVSSEADRDRLEFGFGDVVLDTQGDTGSRWVLKDIALPVQGSQIPGLFWRYAKDGSESRGQDSAWIDDIQFHDQ